MQSRKRLLRAIGLAALMLQASAASALACSFTEGGEYHTASDDNRGIRSDLDFVAVPSLPSGVGIRHFFFIEFASGAVLYFGTYNGVGVNTPNSDCSNDFSGWNPILFSDDVYGRDCHEVGGPTYFGYDDGIAFKSSYGDNSCSNNAPGYWRNFTEGTVRICQDSIGFDDAAQLRVTAYAVGSDATPRTIDVHYASIDRLTSSSSWVAWSSTASGCADTDYDLRVINNHDVWIERE